MAILTPALCRAARALLEMHQDELAKRAKVSIGTLRNYEAGKSKPVTNNLESLQAVLEQAGVVFVPQNGGGDGVRWKDPRS